ncbi:MAG: DUF2442 domain-containing protein [Pirellulales bacterium]|jgi:hypothetical protein|nr:DUF2442 domain-containing protein [Pirellulales bacterium]
MPGTSTFPVEVTNVSRHGLWLLVGDEELFLPFEHFPWFRDASIEEISVVERQTADHLRWPLLDIDVSVESIRTPDAFPLIAKTQP